MIINNNALVSLTTVNNQTLTIFVDFTKKMIGDSNINFPIIDENEKSWKSHSNGTLSVDYGIRGEALTLIERHLSNDWDAHNQDNRIMYENGHVETIIEDEGDYNCLCLGIMFFSEQHDQWLLNMITSYGNFSTTCDREIIVDNVKRDEKCFEILESENYVAFTCDIGEYGYMGSFVSELIVS